MKKSLIFPLLLILTSCAGSGAQTRFADVNPAYSVKDADVVVTVIPQRIKLREAESRADVLGLPEDQMSLADSIAVFSIKRVLKGKLAPMKVKSASLSEQMGNAYQSKDYLRLLTFNFKRPENSMPRNTLRVAVNDPYKTFGLVSWDSPEEKEIKLYLKRIKEGEDTFLLIRSVY